MDCLFCKILKGDIPSRKIYEDDYVLAFLDINPDTVGHTLIIPKKHYKDLDDIDSETLAHIISAAKVIKKRLQEKLKIDGLTLVQNNGDIQEIKHFHLHLKPYYKKGLIMNIEKVYELLS